MDDAAEPELKPIWEQDPRDYLPEDDAQADGPPPASGLDDEDEDDEEA